LVALTKAKFAFVRDDEQDVLISDQHELSVAVAPALSLPRTVRQVDARQDAAVEAVDVAVVDDEVVEVRLRDRQQESDHDQGGGHGAGPGAKRTILRCHVHRRW
jgi:hypothetical protein